MIRVDAPSDTLLALIGCLIQERLIPANDTREVERTRRVRAFPESLSGSSASFSNYLICLNEDRLQVKQWMKYCHLLSGWENN